jgi:hypothetical protein
MFAKTITIVVLSPPDKSGRFDVSGENDRHAGKKFG